MEQVEKNQLLLRVEGAQEQGELLLEALREKIAMLNMPGDAIEIPSFKAAQFKLEHDMYNGTQTLRAAFFHSKFYCIGFLLFHSDGSSYAEYNVMKPHPTRPQFFIEAVEAWGGPQGIKTDMRLAEMPK